VAGLTQGSVTAPDWFSVDPGPAGSISYTLQGGPFQGRAMSASREFSCNPRQNREELSLGSWQDALVDSVRKIFREEAPPPFWEGEFSDEAPKNTSSCEEGGIVTGWQCRGGNCDNSTIRCQDFGLKPIAKSGEYGVNSCRRMGTIINPGECTRKVTRTKTRSEKCPPDMFATDFRCNGKDCATISFTCTQFEGVTATECRWTSSALSEEDGGKMLLEPYEGIAGIECSGHNCDNKRFYVCIMAGG
jgi:hypothetical protein